MAAPAIAGHDPAEDAARAAVIEAGRWAAARGWTPATSGNFSVRVDARRIAITASGGDKGALDPADVLVVGLDEAPDPRASAEAPLHAMLYRERPETGAVLHVHSLAATVVSRRSAQDGAVRIAGVELLKAFGGIDTHEATLEVPVFDNDQDVTALAARVRDRLARLPAAWGYLIAGHGLYAWGRDVAEARRHLEAFDFLFQVILTEARSVS